MDDPTAKPSSGPLDGITVLEFGQFVVVPYCAQLLAMCGARVIKVEPLLGDPYRRAGGKFTEDSQQFILKNRGKESIALDLSAEDSSEVIGHLVSMSDVVLVNMSADSIERHRLHYEAIRAMNESIIYGAVSAFGADGPEGGLPGMDAVVQARSGLLYALGTERDGIPFHSEVQAADYTSAFLLFGAVLAAVIHFQRTGEGQEIAISLLAGALALQNNTVGSFPSDTDWRNQFTDILERSRKERWTPSKLDAAREALRPPAKDSTYYQTFRTRDGVVAVGAGSPATVKRLRESVSDYLGIRLEDDFAQTLKETLERESTDFWVTRLRKWGVPVSNVLHIEEVHNDEHLLSTGLVMRYDHPRIGTYSALGPPFTLSRAPLQAVGETPLLGEHTRKILIDSGLSLPQIEKLLQREVIADRSAIELRIQGASPSGQTSESNNLRDWKHE